MDYQDNNSNNNNAGKNDTNGNNNINDDTNNSNDNINNDTNNNNGNINNNNGNNNFDYNGYQYGSQNFIMVDDVTPTENTSGNASEDKYSNDHTAYENGYANSYTAPEYEYHVKKKKKKEPKFITRKAFIITLICCMIATSALTIFGYNSLNGLSLTGTTKSVSATNYTLAKATGSELSTQEIIAKNENSVVEIRTESVSTDQWVQNYVTQGAGSGVIIDTKGYIVTNNHVIEDASKITVTLKDGTEASATVVGTDSLTDIAVLKINVTGLTAVTYGDSSKLSVGDLIVAIGNPLGELGGTATTGILSALDRTLEIDGKSMTLLQTDASINPGNSGGGLFDQYGNLIGLVVAKSTGSDVEGLGFAIPVNKVAETAKQLIENGRVTGRAAIGISIVNITDSQTASQYGVTMSGVYIKEVTGSNAKSAGLKAGDMIYSLGDTKITSSGELQTALEKYEVGDKVTMKVIRDNKTITIKVTLSESE